MYHTNSLRAFGKPARVIIEARVRLRRVMILGVAALAGCSFAPDYEAPALPIPAHYPAETASVRNATPSSSAAALSWQSYFADPELRALISTALANNRDLRIMVLRVEEARIAYGVQRGDLLPSASIGVGGARFELPAEISPTGQARANSQYFGGITASWEIDFWGRVRNLSEAAFQNYLATDAARQAATLSLIVQVASTYLTLREYDERILIADQAVVSRQRTHDMFRRRFEVGSGNKFDLTQAETLLTQAQSLSAQLRQNREIQLHALALLVGEDQPLQLAPSSLEGQLINARLEAGLPSDLLVNRPDIMAAENRLRASNANIGAARAAFLPRISLTGAFGGISTELNSLFDVTSRAWLFSPSISVPIFDAGRTMANLDVAQVRKNIAIADYEKSIQTAFRDVADNLSANKWLAEQIDIQRRTAAAQAERARLATLRYDRGSSSYFEVLDAERDLLTIRQQIVQLQRALLTSQVGLYAALGGGTQSGAPESAPSRTPSPSQEEAK